MSLVTLPDHSCRCSAVYVQALRKLQQLVSDSWQGVACHHDLVWFLRLR
jgi:hypothetical protein